MKTSIPRARRTPTAAAALASMMLAACGGGSDASSPANVTLSGMAATGAALAGAAVTVQDRSGAQVCTTASDDQGSYTCTLDAAARAPFVVTARLEEQRLYSTSASAEGGTVNVTPLTTLIVARLAPDGDPATLAQAIQDDPGLVSSSRLKDKVDEVQALIAPLRAATGDATDPIAGHFAADGQGHDKVLDSLQISIRPEDGHSNIEITVKTQPASDGAEPLTLSFKSSDAAPAPLTAPIRSDELAADGIVGKINGLMGRFTACYAEPLSQRIAGVASGATQATGDATAVQAPPCKSIFLDNDPTTFLDNGARVGAGAAFPGLYRDSATGVKFDRAVFEYQWANGDFYITFRTTTRAGTVAWSAVTARQQGGQLKVVGNRYAYEATVRPFAADREFPLQPQFSWFGSGYSPAIQNRIDPLTQLPIFKEAYVTAPDGRRSTYRPLSGRSLLGVVTGDGHQRVNVVQFMAAQFQAATTAGTPAAKDGGAGAFFLDPQRSDEQMLALPDQGVWTIEWVHADETRANVTQIYRTLTRAPTIGEIRHMKFAQLSEAFKAELVAREDVATTGALRFGEPSADQPSRVTLATAASGDGWTVPEGAAEPTSVAVFGVGPNSASFNDGNTVALADRHASISCSAQSLGDLHCDTSTGVTQFAAGSRVDAIELWTRNARQLSLQKQVNLYRLAP